MIAFGSRLIIASLALGLLVYSLPSAMLFSGGGGCARHRKVCQKNSPSWFEALSSCGTLGSIDHGYNRRPFQKLGLVGKRV